MWCNPSFQSQGQRDACYTYVNSDVSLIIFKTVYELQRLNVTSIDQYKIKALFDLRTTSSFLPNGDEIVQGRKTSKPFNLLESNSWPPRKMCYHQRCLEYIYTIYHHVYDTIFRTEARVMVAKLTLTSTESPNVPISSHNWSSTSSTYDIAPNMVALRTQTAETRDVESRDRQAISISICRPAQNVFLAGIFLESFL